MDPSLPPNIDFISDDLQLPGSNELIIPVNSQVDFSNNVISSKKNPSNQQISMPLLFAESAFKPILVEKFEGEGE